MSELTVRPAVELLAMLERRELSPCELGTEYVREIVRLDPLLHAFADFDPDRVLRACREPENSVQPRGALWGLPMSIKASIATAGHRCELGSMLRRGFTPAEDAVVVERCRRAGAVVLGTTNCPEFLMAYETDNLLYGATANPWDLARSAGGSSGGEAAAIAAGLSACGLGSDSGGSVREPAHFTGICSLKPTPGRIPATGHLAAGAGPFATLGAIGPMARTIRDVSLLFRVLSGQHEGDPASVPIPLRNVEWQALRSRPIAVLEDDGLAPVSRETREAVRSAASALAERGFRVASFQSKWLEPARRLWWFFFVRCGRMLLEPLIAGREAELSSTFRYFLEAARGEPTLSGDDLLRAWMQWEEVRAGLLHDLSHFCALLSPVCSIPAFRHGERAWIIDGEPIEYFDAMRFTQWFNLLGAPAAVVPVSRSAEGLPIGVQIAAAPFQDEEVLALAGALDEDFGYRPPPLALAPLVKARNL